MPIECSKNIKAKDQAAFNAIDYEVMNQAFSIHNSLGRFLDESIYNRSLTAACNKIGFCATSEIAVKVSHKDFCKLYYIDILVDNGIIYELKTSKELNSNHKQQLLNYLMLTNINHGKLINFRTGKVGCEFVSTKLSNKTKQNYKFDTSEWDSNNKEYRLFENKLKELFVDWGGFLDVNLYNEGITYFMGGKDLVSSPVDIIDSGKIIGQQKMALLNNSTAFHFSAVADNFSNYKIHIKRLLNHSNLKTILWINLNKEKVTLTTIN